jgi:hypothetical protein
LNSRYTLRQEAAVDHQVHSESSFRKRLDLRSASPQGAFAGSILKPMQGAVLNRKSSGNLCPKFPLNRMIRQ